MEKTGNLEKLTYDFNTASNLEVWMPNLDGWYRVTSREFRSFNGKRRILNIENPNKSYYEEYNGPIYYYGTNQISKKLEKIGLSFANETDPRDAKRPQDSSFF